MFIPDATLNFHELGLLTSYDIEKYLNEFLEDCYNKQNEYVLIITGKGFNSPEGPKVRPQVYKILKRHKLVAKFKYAGFENGGRGAFEVIII